jgi:tetratricopeptide (TPR) repeat protein
MRGGADKLFDAAIGHHRQGRLVDAEKFYRAAIDAEPTHIGALNNLGLIRSQQGNLDDAAVLFRQAVEGDPRSPEAHSNLGTVLQTLGRHEEALGHYAQATALAPGFAMAHANAANALIALGRSEEAVAACLKALAVDMNFAPALNTLGNALQALGRYEEAAANYRRVLDFAPDHADAHNNLGGALAALERQEEAIAHYRQALAAAPNIAQTHYNLGVSLLALSRPDEALTPLREALALRPDYAEAQNSLGNALQALDRHEEAATSYAEALAAKPDFAIAHSNLGNSLQALNRHDAAIVAYRQAIALQPDLAEAHNNLGETLKMLGRIAEARETLETALTAAPRTPAIHLNLSGLKRFTPNDPHFAALKALSQEGGSLSRRAQAELDFALAKAFDDVDDIETAFTHWARGSRLMRQEIAYEEAATLTRFGRICAVFTPELLGRLRAVAPEPTTQPIFIFGMPRSGTTLIEQVLASHGAIHGGGELAFFGDEIIRASLMPVFDTALSARRRENLHAKHERAFPEFISATPASLQGAGGEYIKRIRELAPTASHITDKMPTNFQYVGLIHALLPNARLIHVVRDPVETCFSCFSRLFAVGHGHTYDLGELGRYYRAYARLMRHWRETLPAGAMLEVRYEDVVSDLDGQVRRLVAYCGLEWDPACLAFHQTDRPVRTASAAQVRQPIYTASLARSARYSRFLGPLINALGDTIP